MSLLRAVLLLLLLGAVPSSDVVGVAQMTRTGAGMGSSAAAVSYTGPGDIVASAAFWGGLRGYSAAVAATGTQKSINIRRASDNTTTDIVILTTGALDVATATTFCNATTCFVTKLYDQSGNGRDAAQATAGNQPQLLLASGPTSLPIISFNGSQWVSTSASLGLGTPTYIEGMVQQTNSGSYAMIVQDPSTNHFMDAEPGPVLTIFDGARVSQATTDSAWHCYQGLFNTTGSVAGVDGAETTGTTSSGNHFPSTIFIGSLGSPPGVLTLIGYIGEIGLWGTAPSSGTRTSMNSNVHTYWGF